GATLSTRSIAKRNLLHLSDAGAWVSSLLLSTLEILESQDLSTDFGGETRNSLCASDAHGISLDSQRGIVAGCVAYDERESDSASPQSGGASVAGYSHPRGRRATSRRRAGADAGF